MTLVRPVLAAALASLVCAACSQSASSGAATSAATPPSASVAVGATSGTPAVASPAAPADAAGAEAFLRQALQAYVNPAPPPTMEELNARARTAPANETAAQFADREARENAALYTPQIVDLIRRDRLSTEEGSVGVLDFVPLCMCQDDTGIRLRSVTTAPGGNGRVVATVIFDTEGQSGPKTHRYTLERTPAGWRIANVVDMRPASEGGEVDALAHLTTGVPEQERAFRAAQSGSASGRR